MKKPKAKMGRPKKVLVPQTPPPKQVEMTEEDWQVVEGYAMAGSSEKEVVNALLQRFERRYGARPGFFEFCNHTILNLVNEKYGMDFIMLCGIKQAAGVGRVRAKLFEKAMQGDTSSIIFFLKNYGGMKDALETTVKLDTKSHENMKNQIKAMLLEECEEELQPSVLAGGGEHQRPHSRA